jgi:dTMP kinase
MDKFIVFEGIEGAGKTTLANMLSEHLVRLGEKVHLTREPGGTEIGKEIRKVLLSRYEESFTPLAELLLYEADRNLHVENVIKPKLEKGYFVISDRYIYSTIAYQHFGRGIDRELVDYLNKLTTGGLEPSIVFLIDVPVEVGLERVKETRTADRLEEEDIEFHKRLRKGFLTLANEYKDKFYILDGTQNLKEIFDDILSILRVKHLVK